ncbi:CLUMA_CG007178, isoform A [Clunio marinus]|uniref:CLUMA_CG007178, isoform A n=1 Tax=Clunio marinus TaxID=568069 RepID=A0A1J1I5K0_9DIPT|nr:CLUMA_CG007178, isoform A [Clunio marinus]
MLVGWRKTVSKCFIIPQRVVLSIMGFLAIVNAYTMRICLNVAITEMVVKYPRNDTGDNEYCVAEGGETEESVGGGSFQWSESQQGLILGAFYWGYVITHIPGGILAEKFGGKWVLGLGILSTAIFTVITPWVINIGGATGLFILRVFEGLGEGTTFPALSVLLSSWIPLKERSKLGSFVFGGGQVGTIVGTILSGLLIDYFDTWESVFYFFGFLGALWFLFFLFLCYNDPNSHPFIKDSEKEYLQREMGVLERDKTLPPTPWKAIFTSIPMMALVCAQIGHDFGFYIMATDLPKYMSDVLRFSIKENGFYSSLPYASMWVASIAMGFWSDWMIVRNIISITNARKFFTTVASVGPAVFIVAASYAGCNRITVVILFTIAMGTMGGFYPGMKVNPLDLSPNYSGSIMATTNGIGALTGILGPYLVGLLTGGQTLTEWRLVFWIAFIVFNVTAVVYCIWASAEIQPWNDGIPLRKSNDSSSTSDDDFENPKEKIEDLKRREQKLKMVTTTNPILKRFGLCLCYVPARLILTFMGFLAVINAYTMRSILNIAITEMTYKEGYNATIHDNTCPSPDGETYIPPREGFEWSEQLQGIILGAFYWGYALNHVPGGVLSAKYGGKYTLSLGILSTAIFTLITPWVVGWGGATGLIVLRVLEGFGEGTTFPALNTLLAAWIPIKERSKASALVYGGAQIGNIAANSISGVLLDYFDGWSSPFYFFGICGVVWFICFEFLCYSDPKSHPFITNKEKNYLLREMKQLERDKRLNKTPWKAILTSVPMIALVITQIGHGFGYFTVVTDLPKYMSDVLKFNVKQNGFYSSLPYVAMWISTMIFGVISDWCIAKEYIGITNSRKLYTTLSFTVPGIFLVFASFVGCDRILAVTLFTVAMGFMGAYYSGMKVNALDLSPNYAGTLMGITNGISALTGIAAPYVVGVLTPDRTLSQWRLVFFISCAFLIFTNIIYIIFASAKVQPWNTPEGYEPDNKTIENTKQSRILKMSDFYLPQRILLAFMAFLGFVCEYMMRNLLSIAITQIAVKTYTNESIISGDVCPITNETFAVDGNDDNESLQGTYEWSEALQGVILSSFYWGYIITHIPGGMLVERFGGKITLLAGIISTSILTCLTPFAITFGGSNLLIINRVVMGLCQGFIYASVFGLLASWIPLRERTTLGVFVLSGIQFGSILSTYLSGILLQNLNGWAWPFYIYSIIGIIWCAAFMLICSKDPESNRFISIKEKNYLRKEIGVLERDSNLPSTPFKKILTSIPVWAIIISQTGIDFSFYVMTTDLPKYLSDVMRFDVEKNGFFSSLPQVLNFFSAMGFGLLSDFCINKEYLSVKNTRKIFTTTGIVGLAVCFIMASYSGCDHLTAILFFSFASGFAGLDNSRVNNMDLSPNYAPTIISIVNSCGSVMGIIAPLAVGLLTKNSTIYEWRIVFWMVFGILIATGLFYLIFADGKIQKWNDPNIQKNHSNGYGIAGEVNSTDNKENNLTNI